MEDLKPCPFCGGEARWGAVENRHYVKCMSITCNTRPSTAARYMLPSKEEAIRAWNTRADTDEVANLQDTLNTAGFMLAQEKAEVARLREALGEAIEILVLIGGDGAWDRDIDKLRRSLNSKGPADNT